MEHIENIPLSSASVGGKRIGFLSKAGLSLPPEVPRLVKLPHTDFNGSLPEHADAARAFLVEYRKNGPERKPEEAKYDIFRLPYQKRRARDETSWTFKKREVAHAFDNLLSHKPLLPAGVAQALLSHVSLASLDELWCHFNDRKLEKRTISFFTRAGVPSVPEIPWLDRVTHEDNVEYVRLMCQVGLAQGALDRAFSIALERQSMEVIEMLLAFGATTAACQDGVCERIQLGDASLARLLLSARPDAVSLSTWWRCFSEGMAHGREKPPLSLLLYLSQKPGIICGTLLLEALKAENLQATAAIIAYASPESGLGSVGQSACCLVSEIRSLESRHRFFVLLADGGLVADYEPLRKELMADIEARHFPLVRLLVDAGVALDVEPHNTVTYLVSKMDLEMLEWVQGGTYYTPASLALNSAPDSAQEPLLLRLVKLLAPRGLDGQPLDAFLVLAARKRYAELARMLLSLGASVEYDMACAIKAAVTMVDLSMLDTLLQGPCSPHILSSVLPVAMEIQPRPNRLRVVNMLLIKGVIKRELGIPLQTVVAEAGDIDSDLVHVLVKHGAPVEGVGNDKTNALLQAAQRCNPGVVQILGLAQPYPETFSKAVPIAFGARDLCGYNAALETVKLLLEHGANGTHVHKTLLAAAIEDHRQDVVRILVQHGADANFANGAPFDVALKAADGRLLEILCLGCPPSQESIVSVLYKAVDPSDYSLEALELLLGSAKSAGAALNASWDADKFRGNPNLNTIIPCFLRHGLDVNPRGCDLVCFAVQETDVNLLRYIVFSGPNIESLTKAFKLATMIELRTTKIEMMSILLNSAKSAEIGQSKELLMETAIASGDDFDGLRLLLRHGAAIDFDNGIAVRVAASAGHLKVLDYLLAYTPAVYTLHNACLAAAASNTLSSDQKRSVFICLLNARERELTDADHMSKLLAESVGMFPNHEELPVLLIQRGVKMQFETLMVATRISSQSLFKTLVDEQTGLTIIEIFREAMVATISPGRKYWVCKYLLGRGIPNDEISIALINCLESGEIGDLTIPKLLLEHRADVGYKKCAAINYALSSDSLIVVKLLSQYLRDDDTACVAFDLAVEAAKLSPSVRAGVYSCLLQWNISTPSIQSALLSNLTSPNADIDVANLLLNKGADPNQDDALCFILAAAADEELVYRSLSKRANLSLVLKALLDHFQSECEVLLWFNRCLEEQHHSAMINDHDLLYQCMQKFPAGSELLRVILGRGVSSATLKPMALYGSTEPEQCTPLIWALFADIKNDTILAFLESVGRDALPAYSTPRTQVTAPFACLLDKTRTPILLALLALDRESTLECTTPESTLQHHGAGADLLDYNQASAAELPLPTACMMLGNFEAYLALNCTEVPNNGLLHAAAFLALPKFVEWLLAFHDPNEKVPDEYDQMVPLALVCASKPYPWCKIAQGEATFETRRAQCIKILAPVTNLNWRYREKTVLHIALENGLEVTRNVFEALEVGKDSKRDDKYLHLDKDGIEYSLDEYVLRRLGSVDDKEKKVLVTYLRRNKIKSRYFRRVMPGDGVQPEGYRGLPPPYDRAWELEAHKENASRRAALHTQLGRTEAWVWDEDRRYKDRSYEDHWYEDRSRRRSERKFHTSKRSY